jgi:hypothetical protein
MGNIDVFSGLSMAATATVPTAVRADPRMFGDFVRDASNLTPSSMGSRISCVQDLISRSVIPYRHH